MNAAGVVRAIAAQEVMRSGRLPTAEEIARATRLGRRTVGDALAKLVSDGVFETRPGGGWRLPTVRRDGARVGRVVMPVQGSPARRRAILAVVSPGEVVPRLDGESLTEHQVRVVTLLLEGRR